MRFRDVENGRRKVLEAEWEGAAQTAKSIGNQEAFRIGKLLLAIDLNGFTLAVKVHVATGTDHFHKRVYGRGRRIGINPTGFKGDKSAACKLHLRLNQVIVGIPSFTNTSSVPRLSLLPVHSPTTIA